MDVFVILNDEIKNPLAVISILSKNLDELTRKQVRENIQNIDNIVTKIDCEFVKSDKFRSFMARDHGM